MLQEVRGFLCPPPLLLGNVLEAEVAVGDSSRKQHPSLKALLAAQIVSEHDVRPARGKEPWQDWLHPAERQPGRGCDDGIAYAEVSSGEVSITGCGPAATARCYLVISRLLTTVWRLCRPRLRARASRRVAGVQSHYLPLLLPLVLGLESEAPARLALSSFHGRIDDQLGQFIFFAVLFRS